MIVAPDSPTSNADWIRDLCNFIRLQSTSGERITLSKLALRAQLSPFHLQRSFKAVLGMTPRQYAEACRLETFKEQLRYQRSVTDATYEAGFGSSSRIYERTDTYLRMTPGTYRTGGQNLGIFYTTIESSFGLLLLAATDRGLCCVQFGESQDQMVNQLRTEFPGANLEPVTPPCSAHFHLWIEALQSYLRGEKVKVDLPLDIRGTVFQTLVWKFLQTIPPGQSRTYAEVATAIGKPGSARAVGTACGANPIALAIPCHRVLRGDGQLGGYRWGLDRKQKLLDHETVMKGTA